MTTTSGEHSAPRPTLTSQGSAYSCCILVHGTFRSDIRVLCVFYLFVSFCSPSTVLLLLSYPSLFRKLHIVYCYNSYILLHCHCLGHIEYMDRKLNLYQLDFASG